MKAIRTRTAYWIKLVLIGILLIVTQLIAYLVVLQKYNISLKTEYERSLDFNFENYNRSLNTKFSEVYDNFIAYYEDQNYDAFARGEVSTNRKMRLSYDGKSRFYDLNSSDYNNIVSARLSFSTLRYLTATGVASDEPLAVLSKIGDDGVCRLLFLDKTKLLANSDQFGYQNFNIIDASRTIVLGSYPNKKTFHSVILPSDLERDQIHLFQKVDGVEGIVSLSPLSLQSGYWLVGFLNNNAMVSAIQQISSEVALVMCLTLVLCVAFTLAAAIIYTKKQDFIYGYNLGTKDFYVVYTDNFGKIKRSNSEFKAKYNVKMLFDAQNIDTNFHQLATNDNYIIKLVDRQKQTNILNFLTTKTSRGFKLVGVEGADVTEYFVNQIETPFIDVATSLYNKRKLDMDYNAFHGAGRRLLGAIKLSNLTMFGTLFGRKFFGEIRKVYANRIKEQFHDLGEVYIIASDTFAVYLKDEESIVAFLRDVEKDMLSLNLATHISENVLKIIVKAGFVIVDDLINSDFNYVRDCVDATLKRAIDSDNEYFVYHESQKVFYEKYFNKEINVEELLQTNSLEMYYQPQLSLKSGKICGFEALLRMKQNLDLNVFELVCHAEQSGQMVRLGNFVFNEGMKFAAKLNEPKIDISLNVSPVQLMQAGFTEDFLRIYRNYDLKEHMISLEVTESFMMSDVETTILKFNLLRDNGIDVCLDDFGMGYSSLQYLKKLPVSVIKIDREFIKDIDKNEYSQTITKMIIKLGHDLGLKSIAEGVENSTQYDILKDYGCDIVQGFIVSKAVSADSVRTLLYQFNGGIDEKPMEAVADVAVAEKPMEAVADVAVAEKPMEAVADVAVAETPIVAENVTMTEKPTELVAEKPTEAVKAGDNLADGAKIKADTGAIKTPKKEKKQ